MFAVLMFHVPYNLCSFINPLVSMWKYLVLTTDLIAVSRLKDNEPGSTKMLLKVLALSSKLYQSCMSDY